MLFAHSIARLDETNVIKQVFIARAKHFREHLKDSIENKHNSPALDILRVAYNFGMYEILIDNLFDCIPISKSEWKKMTWDKAWDLEERQWTNVLMKREKCPILFKTLPKSRPKLSALLVS